jgi:predicted transcriptional regulator
LTEPNGIPERVTRLEREVAAARGDSAAARVLAGAADRDVSEMQAELRAHTRTVQALRTTQVEQGQEMREGFTEMREGFARVDTEMREMRGDMREGFTRVDTEMRQMRGDITEMRGDITEMRQGIAVLGQGQAQITALLTRHPGESDES